VRLTGEQHPQEGPGGKAEARTAATQGGYAADTNTNEITAFAAGVTEGLDPQERSDDIADDGTAVTNAWSRWNGRVCATCGHTFRRGDRVRTAGSRGGTVAHLDPLLHYAGSDPADGGAEQRAEEDESILAEFSAGLLSEWPPLDGVRVTRLEADDWHVARPGRRGRPIVCLYCAHTFRPGEHVVLCPCAQSADWDQAVPGCGEAVHRDPAVGLPCWEKWCPTGEVTVCPVRHIRTGGGSR
jgi:hypothetical protein